MDKSNRKIIGISMVIAVTTAMTVSLSIAFGGEYFQYIAELVPPVEQTHLLWKTSALVLFTAIYSLIALRFYIKSFAALTLIFLAAYFSASIFAQRVFDIDLFFIPLFVTLTLTLVLIQLSKVWMLDSNLTKKLETLSSSGFLLDSDHANKRVEGALELLRTVLPLSEVIVFKYERSGELNPIGRSRNNAIHESLTTRQNSWRDNVEQCERALKDRQTVIEKDDDQARSAKVALPLITENVLVGGLFVDIKQNFERNDIYLLEGFSEQLARNLQRMELQKRNNSNRPLVGFLSTQAREHDLDLTNLINGLLTEQSFGVVGTSSIKEAHAIIYLDGTVAYINRQMRKLANLGPREVFEIDVFDLLGRFKTDVFIDPSAAIRRVLQTGTTYQSELVFDEKEVILDLEIKLVKIAREFENVHDTEVPKKPACFLISLRDITAKKENEKLRSDVVNLLSHELRTPITSINGFAEMLKLDENVPDEAREYLDTIAKESQRAANLLSNFLSVADLQQSDKQEFNKSSVRVNALVDDVMNDMEYTAKQKRIRLIGRKEKQIPPILADRGLLTKAILHLVDNAVKYSPERSSVIISTLLESDFLRVEVEDRGYGIAPAEQERIWNKFYRVARDGQDKEEESTGLGLSLVKEIAEQHSGSVDLESEVGRGSKFIYKIPRF